MKTKHAGTFVTAVSLVVFCAVSCGRNETAKKQDLVIQEKEEAAVTPAEVVSENIEAAREVPQMEDPVAAKDISQGGAGGTKFMLSGYSDKTRWEVEGDSAEVEGENAKLQNVVLKAEADDLSYTIESSAGTFDTGTKQAHLEDDVKGRNSDGVTFMTSELTWNPEKQSVANSSPITISKENTVITGTGIKAETGMQNVELEKDVKVTVMDRKELGETRTEITCDGKVEFAYDENVAVFRDNVKVTDARGMILCDEMRVEFDPGTREIVRMIATGNVKVVDRSKVTYSEKVEYDKSNNTVTWTGNPRVVIYPKGQSPEEYLQ